MMEDDKIVEFASIARPSANSRPVRSSRFEFTLFDDIDEAPRKHWLMRDVLGAGELSIVYGAPGSGKSVVVADMAAHVAAGLPWAGKATRQGAVVYLAAERGALVKRRLAAWRKRHGLTRLPLAVIEAGADLCMQNVDTDRLIGTCRDIQDKTGCPVTWIIVDTVAQTLAGGDENSGRDMGRLVSNLARLQRETRAHVTAIHHVPHGDQARMRGHGVLLGAADATFSVENDTESKVRTLKARKANDGPDDLAFSFSLESETLFVDDKTGEETTAPVVVMRDTGTPPGHKKNVPLPHAEELALRALIDAVVDEGRPPPASAGAPLNTMAIPFERWRSICYERRISDSDKPDTRKKAFSRATDALQRKGRVVVREGFAWPV